LLFVLALISFAPPPTINSSAAGAKDLGFLTEVSAAACAHGTLPG
jgi:hypothetical protein